MNFNQQQSPRLAGKAYSFGLTKTPKKCRVISVFLASGVSLLLAGGALLMTQNAYADATIEVTTDQQDVTIFVKDQKVRMSLGGAQQQNEAIFDQGTQTLHVLDHRDKTVFPLNEKSLNELSGTINAAVDVMQQQMGDMTPEQRAQMEKLMGGLGLSMPEQDAKPEISLNKVRQYSYSNIKCDESKVMEGSQELATVCISQGNSTQLTDQDYQSLVAAQSFMFSIAGKAKQFAKQYGQQIPNVGELELNGLLVNSIQKNAYGDSNANASFRIKSIDVGEVAEISIPTGYRERSLLSQ